MKDTVLILDGSSLTSQDVYNFVQNPNATLQFDSKALKNTKKSRDFLMREAKNKIIYGVNTGFGPMASHIIGENQLHELQNNLIRSHSVGMGDPIAQDHVLAVMIVRLNTLLKGYSGVSIGLLERMKEYINARIIPVIPEHGSVGASGDLLQLSHIALAVIGEGEVFLGGVRQSTGRALHKKNIESKYILEPKEGLALINGTTCMAGIATSLYIHGKNLLQMGIETGAWSLELAEAFSDSLAELLHEVRPHKGQKIVATKIRKILKSSEMIIDRTHLWKKEGVGDDVREIDYDVQQVYSFRCIPQILGPIYETVTKLGDVVDVEINSVTDNPIIDAEREEFLHGGNFHGDYVSIAADHLKMSMTRLSMLSERRINFFLNRNINKRFPPFANLKKPGLTLGLQGLQFVATSTAAQNQSYSFPHHIHSISTNADNQDVVSMGTDAALFAQKVIDNTYIVMAIELVTLAQITDYMKCYEKLAPTSKKQYDFVRSVMPKIKKDRVISKELEILVNLLKKIG